MTRDDLLKRKNQARQEREFHLQQAGMALGIESECERLLDESKGAERGASMSEAPSDPSSPEPAPA